MEELEAALVHQLKTDTAVEKLEAQKQVMRGVARGGAAGRSWCVGREV